MKLFKSIVLLKFLVQFLELFKRIFVMLAGALSQNIHSEVDFRNFFCVFHFLVGGEAFSLPLELLLQLKLEDRLQYQIQIMAGYLHKPFQAFSIPHPVSSK
jgi:hypothetical protein